MPQLDPRIMRIGFEVNGELRQYEGLAVVATGTKYANPNNDECTVKIVNLAKEVRDYLSTETSPFNKKKTPKLLIVEAGRESYGYTEVFRGDIQSVSITQPPDVVMEIKALTGAGSKNKLVSNGTGKQTSLKQISQIVANDLGASLSFEALDKSISRYAFNGAALKQIDALQSTGNVDAYLDGNTLVVKDRNVPLNGKTRILNKNTGMIGIPQFTEWGVKVSMLFDNQTVVGGALDVSSELYPAVNGLYAVYKLDFELATRDTPFYYHAETVRIP